HEPAPPLAEAPAAERQPPGAAADEGHARPPPARAPERVPRRIEAHDPESRAVERQVPPRPTPDVESPAARAVDEPSPPASETGPLVDGAQRVVEPGDLLEAAHRSGLREDDEGARVV